MSIRPYVICHMVATIDGKILSRRWKHLHLCAEVSSLYESTAAEFNVTSWMVGTKTLKEFFPKEQDLQQLELDLIVDDFEADRNSGSFAIGCDAHGSVMFDENEIGGDRLIVITTKKASKPYLANLKKLGISYLLCGNETIDFSLALEKLRTVFKLEKLLLEGGGLINGAMLQAGLIDEISQLFVPVIDGGGAEVSGLYDMRGQATDKAACALELIEQKTLAQGTQWLRYKVHAN